MACMAIIAAFLGAQIAVVMLMLYWLVRGVNRALEHGGI